MFIVQVLKFFFEYLSLKEKIYDGKMGIIMDI